ncbi:MAG TPA: hypothetical protein VLI91_08415 [Roseiarcus sp.]|nr:hypothetical protein [Roseiarcus sp.]
MDANSLLLRGLIPMDVGGFPQLVRLTLPCSVNPSPEGYADGLGDLTVFDLFVLPSKPVLLAVGPLFVAPTATDRFTGAGRWQAGVAGAAVEPQSWGLVGGLVTYQHSFADDFGREPTSLLTVQPSSSIICRTASICARAQSGTSILRTTSALSRSASAPAR